MNRMRVTVEESDGVVSAARAGALDDPAHAGPEVES